MAPGGPVVRGWWIGLVDSPLHRARTAGKDCLALSPPPWRCGAADRGCSPSAATGRASTRTSQDDRRHRHRRVAAPPPTSRRSLVHSLSATITRRQGVRPGAGGLVVGGRPSSPPPRSRWAEQPPNALVRWSARCRAAPRSARRATRRAPRQSGQGCHSRNLFQVHSRSFTQWCLLHVVEF